MQQARLTQLGHLPQVLLSCNIRAVLGQMWAYKTKLGNAPYLLVIYTLQHQSSKPCHAQKNLCGTASSSLPDYNRKRA
jgi:hypothetical protein